MTRVHRVVRATDRMYELVHGPGGPTLMPLRDATADAVRVDPRPTNSASACPAAGGLAPRRSRRARSPAVVADPAVLARVLMSVAGAALERSGELRALTAAAVRAHVARHIRTCTRR